MAQRSFASFRSKSSRGSLAARRRPWEARRGRGERSSGKRREERAMCPIPQLPYSEQNWRLTRRRAGGRAWSLREPRELNDFELGGRLGLWGRQLQSTHWASCPVRSASFKIVKLMRIMRQQERRRLLHVSWRHRRRGDSIYGLLPLNPCKKRLRSAIKIAARSLSPSPFCKAGILITRRAVLFYRRDFHNSCDIGRNRPLPRVHFILDCNSLSVPPVVLSLSLSVERGDYLS